MVHKLFHRHHNKQTEPSINSTTSKNPHPPSRIYPYLSQNDAPYRLSESELRAAIYIPDSFQSVHDQRLGRSQRQCHAPGKIPVLLVPGTGSFGGEAFAPNFAKLLGQSEWGDPVWLNIPGKMCDDAARNAEFVSYAINYICSMCSTQIAVVGWSQGTLSAQWALKYWPSTRFRVRNLICLSALFKGTVAARLLVPRSMTRIMKAPPSIWQQKRKSKFITKLAENEGTHAYVPTTSIYPTTDEVVQPQFGKRASARMEDRRGVGVTNCEIQRVVGKKPAALMYTHFSMLNPLAWALTEDAIIHGDSGSLDRIDLKEISKHTKPEGLNLHDVANTKLLAAKCGKAVLGYEKKCKAEPELPAYCKDEGGTYELEKKHVPYGKRGCMRNDSDVPIEVVIPIYVAVQEKSPRVWGFELVEDLKAVQEEVEFEHRLAILTDWYT